MTTIRITTYDPEGRARVTFSWTPSFSEMIDQLRRRSCIICQRDGYVKYKAGHLTKEIDLINPD